MLKVYSPQTKMEEQHLDNEGLSQGLLSASSHGGRHHMAREKDGRMQEEAEFTLSVISLLP